MAATMEVLVVWMVIAAAALCGHGVAHASSVCDDASALNASLHELRLAINSSVWKSETHVCSWTGVTCTASPASLTLALSNTNVGLRGSLPASTSVWGVIGACLKQLTLSGSQLTGSVPSEMLAQTTVLERLYVASSGLQGTWPNVAMGSTANLSITFLSNSKITGALPSAWASNRIQSISIASGAFSELPDWSNFGALKTLTVQSASSLTGTVPPWSNMSSIESILFRFCGFTGSLPSWTGMPSLASIAISSCSSITGSLPESWHSLASLTAISMSFCLSISGLIPASWSQLSNLQSISLQSCGFTGSLPSWTGMPSLTSIAVSSCVSINGSLPEIWWQLSNLQSINLNAVPVVGPLPQMWGQMASLKTISIVGASLYGASLPEDWHSMAHLMTLTIAQSRLGGTIPSWGSVIGGGVMSNLTFIDLSFNELVGPLPENPGWAHVETLLLSNNSFDSTLPEWSSLVALKTFTCEFCGIIGPLPQFNGSGLSQSLASLSQLVLSNNPINATIPATWGGLSSLSSLTITSSGLRGSIDFAWPATLKSLILTSNQLSGGLSSAFADSTPFLQNLDVSHNALDGECGAFNLPSSMQTLLLNDNQCTGAHPNWTAVPQLSVVNLAANRFKGTVAAVGSNALETFNLSCNAFWGTLPSWSTWHSIATVDVSHNRFTGTLEPFGSSSTRRLLCLNVSHNDLVGPIYFLTDYTKLKALEVASNRLNGSMPSLASHTQLATLNVSNNSLTGTLAVWLSTLVVLDASSNLLSGTVPNWASATRIEHVNLTEGNVFAGTIPKFYAYAPLRVLDLSDLGLSGVFSSLLSTTAKNSIRKVLLGGNHLTGVFGTGSTWSNLVLLNVSSNRLTGPFPLFSLPSSPTSYGLPSNLIALDVSNNTLSGNILPLPTEQHGSIQVFLMGGDSQTFTGSLLPEWFAFNTPNLTAFSISGNVASGASAIPIEVPLYTWLIDGWTKLESFTLRGCGFRGILPVNFSSPIVRVLDLSQNRFHGTLHADYSQLLPMLEVLRLANNTITGGLPSEWSALTALRHVDVSDNLLTTPNATLPASWGSLVQLTELRLQSCGLAGTVPEEWVNMTALRVLDLNGNRIESTSNAQVWNHLSALETLDLSMNGLTEWPLLHNQTEVGSNAQLALSLLNLSSNAIEGTIPSWWTTIASLRVLDISNNAMHATVPLEQWPILAQLQSFNISFNGITGALPPKWADEWSASLEQLDVSNNALSGTLPVAWRFMTHLRKLYIQGNRLAGTLPLAWSAVPLRHFNASSNNFSGRLPYTWRTVFGNFDSVIDLCNNSFCGPPPLLLWPLNGLRRCTTFPVTPECYTSTSSASMSFAAFTPSSSHTRSSTKTGKTIVPTATTLSKPLSLSRERSRSQQSMSPSSALSASIGSLSDSASSSKTRSRTSSASSSMTQTLSTSWTSSNSLNATPSRQPPVTRSITPSNSLTSSRRSKSLRTHSIAVTRTPPPQAATLVDPLQKAAGDTNAGIAIAAGVLSASDISNANVQVMLAYLDCGRGKDSDGNDDAAGALASFVVSPFFPVGPIAMTYGNLAIILAMFACSALWTRGVAAAKKITFFDAMENFACQFPVHALRVFELWIPGCFFGLARAIALGSDDVISAVFGGLAIPVALLAVVGWQTYYLHRVRPSIVFRCYCPTSLALLPRWKRFIAPTGRWEPFRQRVCYGPMFFSLKPHWSRTRVVDIVVSCATSLLTALSGLSGGAACTPIGWILAVVYLAWAIGGLVLQVHRLPFDNVANISVRAIFCILCIFRAEGSTAAPVFLSFLQSALMIVRACLVVYVRLVIEDHLELLPPLGEMQLETEMLSDPFNKEGSADDGCGGSPEDALLIDVADDALDGDGANEEEVGNESSGSEEFEYDERRVFNPLDQVLDDGRDAPPRGGPVVLRSSSFRPVAGRSSAIEFASEHGTSQFATIHEQLLERAQQQQSEETLCNNDDAAASTRVDAAYDDPYGFNL